MGIDIKDITLRDIQVCGHRVLIKPTFIKEETEWGFKLDVGDGFKREKAAVVAGTVVRVGPTAWYAFDKDSPNWKPWAKVGDVVHFAKYGGKFITIGEEDYVIVNDEDVQCVIGHDEEYENV